MEGLFPSGEIFLACVQSDFVAESDLWAGKIVILKKRKTSGSFFGQDELKREKDIPELAEHTLIIHRIVGRFYVGNRLAFWEKGDNDCFPKLCFSDDILAIVTDIEDNPELFIKLQPDLWQERNRKLLLFYQIAGKIYASMENRFVHKWEIFNKIWRKVFWSLLYLFCSFFDLKGQ